MNHIYKSIFNKALGVFTAVPEFASAHGKGSERTVVGRVAKGTAGFAASALAISVGLALTSTSAVAGPGIYINDGTDTGCLAVPDAQGPNVGIHGISGGVPSAALSLLGPSQVVPDRSYYGLDVMKPCLSSTAANATEERSTQTNRTLFYGKNGPTSVNDNGAKNLTLGGRLDVNSGIIGVGDRGVNGTGATNSIRMGTGTTLDEANKKENAISIGVDAGASANNAIAMGNTAAATGTGSVSIGKNTSAAGQRTIAMGENALAGNEASMALGYNSSAKGLAQVSIGQGAGTLKNTTDSGAADATFIGNYAGADSASPIGNLRGVAVGTNAGRNLVSGVHNIAVGYDAGKSIEGSNNVAIGYNTGSNVNGDLNFAGGRDAGNSVKGEKNIALGYISGQNIEGNDNTTVGYSSGNNVTGWGNFAGASKAGQFVEGYNNVAIGYQAGMGTADNLLKTSGGVSISTNSKAKTSFSIAIGDSSSAGDDSTGAHGGGRLAIAIGQSANANFYHAIALGHSSRVSPATGQSAEDGIAIGSGALVDNYKGIAVGAYSRAKGRQSTVIANNVRDSNYSTASGDRSQVYGVETNVSGNNSVAIGDTNTVASARTYAMGNNINVAAGTDDSLVFGTRASVGGNNAIAMGNTATALANGSVAISNQSKAKTTYSIALGQGAVAGDDSAGALNNGEAAIAIGREASANVYNGIALGKQATVKKDSSDGIAIGSETKVNAYKGTAIGAFSEANGSQALAIGNNKQGQSSVASGERSQVIGVESNVSGQDSTAIGYKNTVAAARTYVMGNNINVDNTNAVDSLAFGTSANVKGQDQISIGHNAGADAVATAKNAYGIALGLNAGRYQQGGEDNYAIGQNAGQYVNGTHSVALGLNAGSHIEGDGNFAAADGAGNYIKGRNNIAIGNNAGSGAAGAIVEADRTISVGTRTQARGNNAVAIGTDSKALAVDATAVGQAAQASAEKTVAVGQGAKATERFTVAMGHNATASHANSVALGTNSATSDAHTGDYTLNTSYTAAGLPVAANGTVSVGSAGKERQIQNVAAGVVSATSTDAINGSQLYATNNYMNNFAGDVKTKLGGNAALGNDGHLTMTNIGGTGENTVDDAIKNLKTAIDNKADTTASVTSENQADIKVDKEAPVGNTTNYKLSLGNDAKAKLAKAATALQTVEGDSNITATKDATDPTKVKLALNKDLTADSLTLGDTTTAEHVVLNKDGLTVGNLGPALSNSGIDMRGGQIGNLVGGPVKYGERTAVSAGMLYDVAKTVQQAIGGETELDSDDPNKSLPSGRLTLSNVGETGESTIHDAIKSVNDKAKTAVQEIESANPTALSVKKDGTKVTLTPNFITGDLVNADGTVNAPATADEGKLVSAKTVADALKANHFVVDTKGNTETGSEADAKVGSGNKVTFEAGNNLVAKQANTANGGATVKFSLKDDISLNSVTAGTGANQVVLGNDGVKVGGNTYINNDGLNANSKVISNVADGVNPNDAVNKSQLDAVKGVADSAVKSVDTVASEENLVVDNNDPQNPKLRLKKAVNLTSIKLDGATPGNTTYVSGYGLTIEDGPSVKKEGINAGDKKITNVAAGDVSATSKDAVNGAQLHNVASSVANVLGGNAAVDGNGNVTSSDIGGTGANTVDDAIKAVNATAAKHTTVVEGKNVKVTKGKNAAGGDEYTVATKDDLDVTSVTAGNTTVNTNGLTITGGPSVTRGGIDAGNAVITNVRDGKVEANSKDAVNGGQLHATNTKLDGVKAKADTAVQDVKSGDENALTAVKDPSTNIVTVTPKLSGDLVDANGNITAPTTPAEKGKLVTAGTVAQALANTHFVVDTKATDGELDTASQADQKIKAGNKVTLQAGKNLKAKQTNAADGAQVEFSLKDSISLTQVTAGEGDNQVVLGNNGVQVGGNTYINKDGLNANSKVISNVADGVNPNDAVNKGQLDAVKGVADSAVKSVDVANGEQNLVVDNTDPKNPKLSLKKDLTVDSVKAGDSTLNTDGLTIAGGPSVKKDGIDAGDKKITNVAAGDVSATSKDAVNGGQLYNVANNVKDLIGPDAAIDPATGKVTVADPAKGIGETGKGTIGEAIKSVKDKADTAVQDIKSGDEKALSVTKAGNTYTITPNLSGDLVDADGNITAPATDADKGKLVTAGTVAQALANTHFVVDTKATDGELDTASEADQKVKAGNKVTLQAGKNLKAKQTNGANGAQVEFSLKDSISLTQVTAGEGDNQVVLGNNGVQVGGNTYINKDGLNANSKVISNVADGVNPNDAVNKGQLDAVKGVADSAVKSVDVANGEQNLVVDNSDPKNPKLSLKKDLTVDSVKAGDSTLNTDGLTIAGGPSVKKDGINAGDKTITNVADGVNAKDAVNKGQLDAVDTKVSNVAQNVVNVLGGDAKAEGNGDITMSNIGGTGKNTVHDAIAAVNKSATAAKTKVVNGKNITVDPVVNPDGSTTYTISTAENLDVTSVTAGDSTLNNDGLTITGGPSVKKDGIDAADKKITNVAPGAVTSTSKDAVNGSQLYSVAGNVKDLIGPDVTIDSATGNITVADPAKGIGGTGKGTIGDAIAAVNKSAVAANTKVKAGSNITVNEVIDEKDGSKTYTVSTAKDLNVDSVKAGNTTINNNGIEIVNGPSMTKDGINAAGKAISNVANGNVAADSKDAVNGGQLHETAKSVADVIGGGATVKDGKVVAGQNGIGNTGQNTVHGAIAAINQNTANNFNQIRGDLRKMDRDLRGGIAGALATAGLPQAFRPGKSMVAAAASTYRGQSGLAIGVSRISDNGKVILKVTGNTNSRGDFGGTIGAGYQW